MKSILLHVYEDHGFEARLTAALDLARAFEAHITCLHATPFEDYLAADPLMAAILPEDLSQKMESFRIRIQERVEERLRREDALWNWIHLNERISDALVRYSILADLVILSLAGRAIEKNDPRPLAPAVATRARAPVLAVPEGLTALDPEQPILVAWNGSPEAAAAARAALPLLKRSRKVALLQVEEKLSRYPRDLVARYLSRHGVHVDIVQRRPIEDAVGVTIVETAAEIDAGLIVMGAYGQSRLREYIFGGVTRALLGNSPIPLLLAH